jgi:predicted ATPase/DNA-binding SARP family transcriptional activator
MAHLTINILGALQILIDNVPVESFESEKVRALLVYLAVEGDRAHPREALIGLLWPDSTEETARHNLSQALFNLRLAIGDHRAKPPYLLITRNQIHFNRESDYSLDLDQFNGYFDAWGKNQSRESTDASSLLPQLEEMVKLYRDEFLQHFSLADSAEFEDWILVRREALRQHMMNALTYLANEYEQRRNFQAARCYALHQLGLDPWREEAHYQIMRVLALEGQRSAALAQYETCKRVLTEELGVEPSAKTRDLYEQIRSGRLKTRDKTPANIPSIPIHVLPVALTPFIGRDQELANLDRLISDPACRCITLVGPGGIGKTRLALQAADHHWNAFADGAAFIPLASVGSIEAVISAIASAIRFAFYNPSDPKVQLLNYLRDKQMLLIVDNAEHLLVEDLHRGTIADLLIDILQGARQIKLLVTSRESLNLQGEWLFEVEGLDFPSGEQGQEVETYGAVSLFVQRAQRARPGFQMNVEDKTSIARLCRLVEGMPLAIELAATWVRLLSPTEIEAEVENNLDFLNVQMRDLPERHRSMQAVFDHSWQMLSSQEKQVLAKLSIFRGGFQRQAAEQVASASLSVLSSLVMRSLLRRTVAGRYDLHELIRQYTALKLAQDPSEVHAAQERHSLYYLSMLKENDAKLRSAHQKEAMTELAGEIDNIRTAWYWAAEHQLIEPLYRVSFTMMLLFGLRNSLRQAESLFERTVQGLRASNPEPETAQIHEVALNAMLAHYGYFKLRLGAAGEAYTILAPTAAILPKSADPSAALYALWFFGANCWVLGKYSEARESLANCVKIAQEYGDRWFESSAALYLGIVAHDEGEYSLAWQYLSNALAIMRELGDPSMIGLTLRNAGRTAQALGRLNDAEQFLHSSLELSRETDHHLGTGQALDSLGQLTYAQGRYAEAQTFFLEAANQFREMGDRMSLSRVLCHQGFNSLALQKWIDARIAFQDALKTAQEGGIIPVALNALIGLAALQVQQQVSQETLALIRFILEHPSSNQETKDLAKQLKLEVESKLTLEEIELAQERAGSRNLDEFAAQFLVSVYH